MRIVIQLFAAARDIVGAPSTWVVVNTGPHDDGTCQSVPLLLPVQLLERKFPLLSEIRGTSLFAVNHEYIPMDEINNVKVYENDEIAWIPPISSG